MKSRIEDLIKESGLQKRFIADRLGITVGQLRNYSKGHSLIPIDKGYILADLLGCKVDDLYKRK